MANFCCDVFKSCIMQGYILREKTDNGYIKHWIILCNDNMMVPNPNPISYCPFCGKKILLN